jgi:ATP-dependent DNA helicase RecG
VLRGVGEKHEKQFGKLGVVTLLDLLRMFPHRHDDRREMRTIAELAPGEAYCVAATVIAPTRLNRTSATVTLRVADDTGVMNIVFFHREYLHGKFKAGEEYVFFGKNEGERRIPRLSNPEFEPINKHGERTRAIVPVYGLTAGLTQFAVAHAVDEALRRVADNLPETLPPAVKSAHELADINYAYKNIHFPRDLEALAIAHRRLIFEELLVIALGARMRRNMRTDSGGILFSAPDLNEFYAALPFSPTNAQKRAIDDAVRDCCSGRVMNRLVQGDVGSGKTLVAMALCWLAMKNGRQASFMAPTELLAEQHYRTFVKILSPLGARVGLLTGGMTAKQKRETLAALSGGDIDVIVGTHALISEKTEYHSLALVITDEQHRFGVAQRAQLVAKANSESESAHVLVMSATPIPRTLSLILYGDLDISVIDELPPGRTPVQTFVLRENQRKALYNRVRQLVADGRQVYFVCPAVEESDDPESGVQLTSAREYSKRLAEKVFPDLNVGLVHGAMRPKEKDAAMAKFVSGETNILVATTVIEVGVDVPNATMMVIENADRFGLSQLHQLRGRVGRGEHESFCVMFQGSGGETAIERLEVLCRTNNGFEIAETDLRQRGPGDFFGSRQHGQSSESFAELFTDPRVVEEVRAAAEDILARDNQLALPEHTALRQSVERVFRDAEGTFN